MFNYRYSYRDADGSVDRNLHVYTALTLHSNSACWVWEDGVDSVDLYDNEAPSSWAQSMWLENAECVLLERMEGTGEQMLSFENCDEHHTFVCVYDGGSGKKECIL